MFLNVTLLGNQGINGIFLYMTGLSYKGHQWY